jgi:uncharacterized protein
MQDKRHVLLVVIVLIAVAFVTGACGSEGASTSVPASEATTGSASGSTSAASDSTSAPASTEAEVEIATEPETDSSTPLGEVIEEAMAQQQREMKVIDDARALGALLNQFWTEELQSIYGLDFDSPDRFEYYRGSSNRPCGGFANPRPNNAYYCNPDQDEYVAFDLNWLQGYLADHPGGATTFLIIAHEWGHAVQDTWKEQGGADVWDPPYTQELNADCLAGVFLAASIDDGTVVEEAGDADEIFSWLYEGGSSPWLTPGDHGTSNQRQAAFSDGYTNDTDYCRQNY